MIETMREYNGAGLAANQVHVLKRIAVIEVQANPRYPEAPEIPLTVVINPIVTPLTDEMDEGWERSEEHTSELQSHSDLVCRLLLEKKKKKKKKILQRVRSSNDHTE